MSALAGRHQAEGHPTVRVAWLFVDHSQQTDATAVCASCERDLPAFSNRLTAQGNAGKIGALRSRDGELWLRIGVCLLFPHGDVTRLKSLRLGTPAN